MRELGPKEVIYSRKLRESEAELGVDPKWRAEELVLTLSQGHCTWSGWAELVLFPPRWFHLGWVNRNVVSRTRNWLLFCSQPQREHCRIFWGSPDLRSTPKISRMHSKSETRWRMEVAAGMWTRVSGIQRSFEPAVQNMMMLLFSCQVVSNSLWSHDCRPLGSSVHGIAQARILGWVAIFFSRGSSKPKDRTRVSCIGRRTLYHWATRKACRTWQLSPNIWTDVNK